MIPGHDDCFRVLARTLPDDIRHYQIASRDVVVAFRADLICYAILIMYRAVPLRN